MAYTLRSGMVTAHETIGKFVLFALQIGSGASLGLEGPTVQICAGVSSMLARLARLGPKNSRRPASVGLAAGRGHGSCCAGALPPERDCWRPI